MRLTALAAVCTLLACGTAQAQQRETIAFESQQKGQPVRITAEIYWPAQAGMVPAMVIHHGSGGISDRREGRFARELVAMGVAALSSRALTRRGRLIRARPSS